MNLVKVVKIAVSFVVGSGTAKITHAIIENNVDPETTADKVTVYAGTAAISGMAVQSTKEYTDTKIDDFVDSWKARRDKKKDKTPTITDL